MGRTSAALALLIAVGVLSAAVFAAPVGRPSLRLLDLRPAKVEGKRFAPRERVRVELSLDDRTLVRRTRANASGRFVVVFRPAAIDRCTDYLVVARGAKGSRALLANKRLTICARVP